MYCLKLKGNSIVSTPPVKAGVSHKCVTKVAMIVARQDIDAGIELLYDYGDRTNNSHKTKKCVEDLERFDIVNFKTSIRVGKSLILCQIITA